MEALTTVAAGGTFVDPALELLLGDGARRSRAGGLSGRQREILSLLAAGLSGEEIAGRLSLSPETVRTHMRNVMNKLAAQTRAHAIAIAIRRGDIDP